MGWGWWGWLGVVGSCWLGVVGSCWLEPMAHLDGRGTKCVRQSGLVLYAVVQQLEHERLARAGTGIGWSGRVGWGGGVEGGGVAGWSGVEVVGWRGGVKGRGGGVEALKSSQIKSSQIKSSQAEPTHLHLVDLGRGLGHQCRGVARAHD